jgi:hypothetical protein
LRAAFAISLHPEGVVDYPSLAAKFDRQAGLSAAVEIRKLSRSFRAIE